MFDNEHFSFQVVGSGVGAVVALGSTTLGSAALALSFYLDRKRQARRLEILNSVMDKYNTWFKDQEQNAKLTCQIEAGK